MTVHYAASYADRFGQESTSIANDGATLSMVVRGVAFAGSDFDDFAPVGDAATARLASFTLHNGSLCSCTIEAEIPLPIATPGGTEHGMLTARLELGSPTPKGASIGSV